ncbi:MAG: 2-hydroxycarboxylate transporter family protein [Deltaproteobacteria bacterium]|jgi:Na+/citrate or Na+/malate symporter|nr:2-hydroxycarboxylate transporter family protein [Deltaproteobacteria bacterium]
MNDTMTISSPMAAKVPSPPFQIYGMPWYFFALFSAVVLGATYLGILPAGMIGAFPLMIVLGAVFNLIGDRTPFINSFLGGGAIVVIFGSAALNTFSILPEEALKTMGTFMKGGGFLDFYIASLITGSIMGMNRQLLIKAALRYLPVILGGVAVALSLGALVGALTGFGSKQAVFFVSIPIMGGGMGAGAVPLSKIFGEGLHQDPATMLSIMVPAVALGNALSIVCGGLLDRLGHVKKSLTGEGQMMVLQSSNKSAASDTEVSEDYKKLRDKLDLSQMGAGLMIATCFFSFGALVNYIFPAVHGYAWMILAVAMVKVLGLLPQKFEICCYQWFQFVMNNLTGVLLVGIGVAYTNLTEVAAAFSGQYMLLVAVTVLGAIIGAGIVGRLVGFYPIEAAITGGLCMSNMGGTGDVAVLSAAKRMELMPFAQISSRIGGAFMLILSSVMLQIFG